MNRASRDATIVSHLTRPGPDARELNQLVASTGVLAPLASHLGAAASWAAGPVTGAVAETLDVRLGDVIIWGWQTNQAIQRAAKATLPGTGPPEHVGLYRHEIRSVHHPQVDVFINERPPLTITFDLTLVFVFDALLLTIQRGLLVGLSPAGCQVEMIFGAHGINATRSARYMLPALVEVEPGPPLLPASAYVASPATGSRPTSPVGAAATGTPQPRRA
jgi:hypothetical protein